MTSTKGYNKRAAVGIKLFWHITGKGLDPTGQTSQHVAEHLDDLADHDPEVKQWYQTVPDAQIDMLLSEYAEELYKQKPTSVHGGKRPGAGRPQTRYTLTTTPARQLQELAARQSMTTEAMLSKLISEAYNGY